MKHYLAFKGVNSELKSAFIQGGLSRQYAVGKIMRSHPQLPFFLITRYRKDEDGWFFNCGCDGFIDRLLLVKVPSSKVTRTNRFLNDYELLNEKGFSLSSVIFNSYLLECYLASQRLKVLEEVDMKKFSSSFNAMKFYEQKYHLEALPDNFQCKNS